MIVDFPRFHYIFYSAATVVIFLQSESEDLMSYLKGISLWLAEVRVKRKAYIALWF